VVARLRVTASGAPTSASLQYSIPPVELRDAELRTGLAEVGR